MGGKAELTVRERWGSNDDPTQRDGLLTPARWSCFKGGGYEKDGDWWDEVCVRWEGKE